ncbi:MAG: Xaa-Pro dipeptidase [Polyangiaceae bacterium]
MDRALLLRAYQDHVRTLTREYERVLAQAGYDGVVIHSGSPKKRTEFDDQYWPLRPTPHFQHWVPVSDPDCALIFVAGVGPLLVWTRVTSYWEKPAPPEHDHFVSALRVERPSSAETVRELLPQGKKLAFIGEDVAWATRWGVPEADVNPKDLVGPLDRLRTRKTEYEALCLAEANRRAAVGHKALHDAFVQGDRSELELHLLYLTATAQDDAETPYKNIVALGENAATLHHVSYRKQPRSRDGETLLVDAGATFLGYCSDITRTWVKGKSATVSTFAEMVEGLEAAQRALCNDVTVGKGYEGLHEASHQKVAEILRSAGIVKGSAEEAFAAGVTRAFYPHGLGHSLGLQCHDVGCALVKPKPENPWLRNTSTIEPTQVFTIEPGIYFIDHLIEELRGGPHAGLVDFDVVKALAPMGGIRIEDDLLVLEPGGAGPVRNFTRELLPVGGARVG